RRAADLRGGNHPPGPRQLPSIRQARRRGRWRRFLRLEGKSCNAGTHVGKWNIVAGRPRRNRQWHATDRGERLPRQPRPRLHQRSRQMRRNVLLGLLTALLLLASGPSFPLDDAQLMDALVAAYPDHLKGHEGNDIVWKD